MLRFIVPMLPGAVAAVAPSELSGRADTAHRAASAGQTFLVAFLNRLPSRSNFLVTLVGNDDAEHGALLLMNPIAGLPT